jgi:hypothetical protein
MAPGFGAWGARSGTQVPDSEVTDGGLKRREPKNRWNETCGGKTS